MNLVSQLNAFLYWSARQRFLGLAVSTWLILFSLAVFLFGFFRFFPSAFNYFWLTVSVLLFVVYRVAKRFGYKHFVPDDHMVLDEEFASPRVEQRVPLRATGIFSVKDYEDYVLEHPAEYWRVPFGQHVLMVQQRPGRFLYQIIEPENIRAVEPGYLLFGREPQKALALRFLVTWGPEHAFEPTFRRSDAAIKEHAPDEERTVFFTFDHDADRYAVWKSLVQNGVNVG